MRDVQLQMQKAIAAAAEYDVLSSLAADVEKRAHYRALATFYRSVADELRVQLAGSAPAAGNASIRL